MKPYVPKKAINLETLTGTTTVPQPDLELPLLLAGFSSPLSIVAAELDYNYQLTESFTKGKKKGTEFFYCDVGERQEWGEYLQYRLEEAIGYIEQPTTNIDEDRLVEHELLNSIDLLFIDRSTVNIKKQINLLGKEGILIFNLGATAKLNQAILGTIDVIAHLFDEVYLVEPATRPTVCYLIARQRRSVVWFNRLLNNFSCSSPEEHLLTAINHHSEIVPGYEYRIYLDWSIPSDASDHLPPPIECQPQVRDNRGGRGDRGGRGGSRGRGDRGRGEYRGRGGEGRGRGGQRGEYRGRGGEARGRGGRGKKND